MLQGRRSKGFTLLEALVASSLLALISLVLMSTLRALSQNTQDFAIRDGLTAELNVIKAKLDGDLSLCSTAAITLANDSVGLHPLESAPFTGVRRYEAYWIFWGRQSNGVVFRKLAPGQSSQTSRASATTVVLPTAAELSSSLGLGREQGSTLTQRATIFQASPSPSNPELLQIRLELQAPSFHGERQHRLTGSWDVLLNNPSR